LPNDFDQIAVVVDWLDACRTRNLDGLLDMYAGDASIECECDGHKTHTGRAELEAYWRPRLGNSSPKAFELDEIAPVSNGVVLDYLSFEGKPVRIFFQFDSGGKISLNRCGPLAQLPPKERASGFGS
jgi:hypothetical protein